MASPQEASVRANVNVSVIDDLCTVARHRKTSHSSMLTKSMRRIAVKLYQFSISSFFLFRADGLTTDRFTDIQTNKTCFDSNKVRRWSKNDTLYDSWLWTNECWQRCCVNCTDRRCRTSYCWLLCCSSSMPSSACRSVATHSESSVYLASQKVRTRCSFGCNCVKF